jgi:hypothetical protein
MPAGKTETIAFDDSLGGFGLRLRAGGSKKWVYQYKLGSKQRRLTFGTNPALGLEQARKIAAGQRLLGHPARLQKAGKVTSLAQFGDTQFHGAGARLPGPLAIAVALGEALGAFFAIGVPGQCAFAGAWIETIEQARCAEEMASRSLRGSVDRNAASILNASLLVPLLCIVLCYNMQLNED